MEELGALQEFSDVESGVHERNTTFWERDGDI